jgi:hypothetical protein
MPAPHALYSKMLAERTASRNVFSFILFYFIFIFILFYLFTLRSYNLCILDSFSESFSLYNIRSFEFVCRHS